MTSSDSPNAGARPLVQRLRRIQRAEVVPEPRFAMAFDDEGVLHLEGGLDSDHVAEVREALRSLDPTARSIVDLSGLHFIDSSGLGCLLAQDDRVRRDGGQLVLRHPGPNLCRVFEVTGADERLCIEAKGGDG